MNNSVRKTSKLALIVAMLCDQALAQTNTDEQTSNERIEKIKVTGSRISRNDVEGAAPVTIIDREAIEKSGLTSVADLIGTLTQTSFGNLKEQSGHTRAGAATSNLRGLGADKTLVLIDGRRMQAETSLGGADLNHIPIGMVDRIEVLSDSASAIYGADAIGGVINIITRDFFMGNQIKVLQSSPSQKGGGDRTTADYTFGFSNDSLSILTGVSVKKIVGLLDDDRPLYNGSSSYSPWGSYVNSSGNIVPHPNCPTDRIVVFSETTSLCGRADGTHPYRINYLEPDLQQVAAMSKFELNLSSNLQLYGNIRYSYKESVYPLLTTLFIDEQQVSADYVAQNLSDLDVGDEGATFLRYIVDDFGHRRVSLKDTTGSATAGLKGIWNNYDWDLALDASQSIADNNTEGQWDQELINQFVTPTDGTDPIFDPINRQSALEQAMVSTFLKETNKSQRLSFDLVGEVGELPGGPIGFSVGLGLAQENYSSDMSDIGKELTADGILRVGIPGGYGSGTRSVASLYSELLFPVIESLEVNLAARFDNYSDFGSTINPKLAFSYRPLQQLLFRGSASTGFKAPTLDLVHQTGGGGFLSRVDQVQCDYDKANAEEGDEEPISCQFPSNFLRERVGNNDLKEETSKSYSLGMVLDFQEVNISTDFYEIIINNLIGLPDIDTILEKELNGQVAELNSEGVLSSVIVISKL